VKQTRTLTFEKIYDSAEEQCKFIAQTNVGPENTTPEEIAEQICEYLKNMQCNRNDAKIAVSFREEV
jgi:hypothetical protein